MPDAHKVSVLAGIGLTSAACSCFPQLPMEMAQAGFYAATYCVKKDTKGDVRVEMRDFK